MSYKMTYGRKFWAAIASIVVILFIYCFSVLKVPESITSHVIVFTIGMVVTLAMMYVGGNVWNKWVKSKHFNQNILDGEEK